MVAGLVATLASLAAFPLAHSVAAIVIAVAAFQLSVNAMLAPMMALVAEEVPDAQRGLATGMFAAGPPLAALLSLAFALPLLGGEGARLGLIGMVTTLCLLPLLLAAARPRGVGAATPTSSLPRRDLALAWISRLLIQMAGNVLFADLLYLVNDPVGSGDGSAAVAWTGTLLLLANVAPMPVSILVGRWSDRAGHRKPFLLALAALAAIGLATMAATPDWSGRAVGFLLFSIGWGAFLPLQVGYIMWLLPDSDHRGRDLGIVNLANTLPAVVGQALTWAIAAPRHPEPLLLTLAVLTMAGGATMLGVRARR